MSDRVRVSSSLAFLLAASFVGFVACEADAPTDPEPTVADPAELEDDELLSGGHAVLRSSAFEGIDLTPTVDESGEVVPDRWRNLRVLVDGEPVDVRRLGPDRMEFDVPVLPSGTYGVDVVAGDASASLSTTLLGLRAIGSPSLRVGCALPYATALVAVVDQVVMYGLCQRFRRPFGQQAYERRIGVMAWRPAVPASRLGWIEGLYQPFPRPPEDDDSDVAVGPSVRSGHFVAKRPGPADGPPDIWVWRLGTDPQPVEPLTCFPGDVSYAAHVAEPSVGLCLAYDVGTAQIWRNGLAIVSDVAPRVSHTAGFVVSDDGWSVLTGTGELLVFDPAGDVVVRDAEPLRITGATFDEDGETLYVASQRSTSDVTRLSAVNRATGAELVSVDVGGRDDFLVALDYSDGRIWSATVTRSRFGGGQLYRFDGYDAATLEPVRSVTVSSGTACAACFAHWFPNASVLRIDRTGRRAYFTGWDDDFGIVTIVTDVFR